MRHGHIFGEIRVSKRPEVTHLVPAWVEYGYEVTGRQRTARPVRA